LSQTEPEDSMLSVDQIDIMLRMQKSMNRKVDPGWRQARYPYLRAVVIEGAEAIEHHGWKWWKKQEFDLSQLQMELIDIWHFILSEMLLRNDDGGDTKAREALQTAISDISATHELKFDGSTYRLADLSLLDKIELLIGLSAARRIEVAVFASIMTDCQLSWTELFCQYVGKNVLNLFRQDNGYKDGTYQKLWGGREDNEVLVDIINSLDASQPDFKQTIYASLQVAYKKSEV
tara:strand:- start:64 stop:762 length:699 start_codon:yes stop_codon:yes gene_type:complete